MKNITYISKLISASISRELSPSEKTRLQNWLNENERNRVLYEKFKKEAFLKSKAEFYSNIDITKAYLNINHKLEKKLNQRRFLSTMKYVATFLLPITIVVLLWNYYPKERKVAKQESTLIKAGNKKAQLILANGERIAISEIETDTTLKEKGIHIYSSNNKLKYNAKKDNSLSSEYNTLVVPPGGEYFLELADGTTVWLNSDSKLRYPINFINENRKVYLEGEAYFNVAHNEKKPFIVNINDSEVKVLGTSFNLKSYQEENDIVATLVEGKISLSTSKNSESNSLILNPGEQGTIARNGNMSKKKVDVNLFTSWKDGRIVFKDQSLKEIMNTIYRWYDIEVFYMNSSIQDIKYTGNIKKYNDFNDFANILELAGLVKFEIKGKTVIIKEYK